MLSHILLSLEPNGIAVLYGEAAEVQTHTKRGVRSVLLYNSKCQMKKQKSQNSGSFLAYDIKGSDEPQPEWQPKHTTWELGSSLSLAPRCNLSDNSLKFPINKRGTGPELPLLHRQAHHHLTKRGVKRTEKFKLLSILFIQFTPELKHPIISRNIILRCQIDC